ncbi:hypothetical protein [Streptomyces sp. ST2-7A]|nr:hypothetical protein [Streptomyces sp. ST2-7A]
MTNAFGHGSVDESCVGCGIDDGDTVKAAHFVHFPEVPVSRVP